MTEIQTYQHDNTPEISDDGLDLLMKQAEAMGAAHKLATVLCNTQMVPATFRGKPDDGAAAILYGAELGLKPQQALQQVFVVHGQPSIYARTMVALLKAKGYRFETVESTDTAVTITGTAPSGETETSTWSIDRAKKAGYTSNKKYQSAPQAMLYAKAASEVARRLAPDVLLGIKYTAEDLELEPVKMTATRDDSRGVSQVRAALAAKKEQEVQEQQDAPALSNVERVQAVTSREELDTIMGKLQTQVQPDEWAELVDAAKAKAEEL